MEKEKLSEERIRSSSWRRQFCRSRSDEISPPSSTRERRLHRVLRADCHKRKSLAWRTMGRVCRSIRVWRLPELLQRTMLLDAFADCWRSPRVIARLYNIIQKLLETSSWSQLIHFHANYSESSTMIHLHEKKTRIWRQITEIDYMRKSHESNFEHVWAIISSSNMLKRFLFRASETTKPDHPADDVFISGILRVKSEIPLIQYTRTGAPGWCKELNNRKPRLPQRMVKEHLKTMQL